MYTCAPLYPGPTSIHPEALKALSRDYFPARYSLAYAETYEYVCTSIQKICNTKNDVILLTGEAILGLWASLKSTLTTEDRVLAIGTGVFGDGFADMARAIGCEAKLISYPYNSTINNSNLAEIEEAIDSFKPTMITVVHCETPSGTLNPLDKLGELKKKKNVPLLVVDAVSSIGGTPIFADDWNIDILIGGSQKCFSCPADMTILSISSTAWEYIDKVSYVGYEALKPFMGIGYDPQKYPYTPHSSGVYALNSSLHSLELEGYENAFKRHLEVAEMCREGIKEMGLELYVEKGSIPSPTVTAVCVPNHWDWQAKQNQLLEKCTFLGGSLASLSGKVFRLGHMGIQADKIIMKRALEVLKSSL